MTGSHTVSVAFKLVSNELIESEVTFIIYLYGVLIVLTICNRETTLKNVNSKQSHGWLQFNN